MTYRNATRLCFSLSLALLSCSSLGGFSIALAAPETPTAAAPIAQPSPALPPQAGSAPRPKAAVPPAANPPVQAAPVVAISQDVRPPLDASTFINTMRAAWTYKRIAESGGWPSLPEGTVLKAGDKGPLVVTLRQRLAVEGD